MAKSTPRTTPSSTTREILRRVWGHLRPRRRRQFWLVLVIMILASFAEVVSIGAVFPLLGVLTMPEIVFEHPFVRPLVEALGVQSPQELLLPTIIVFGIVALLSGVTRLLTIYATTRFSHAVGADISADMYRRTLYQPYAVHVMENSSSLISGITGKAGAMTTQVLLPVLNLLSSSLLILGSIVALFAINPLVTTVILLIVLGLYWLISQLTRAQLRRNGETISRNSVHVVRALQEGLGGIRDIIIDGTQEQHFRIFQRADHPLRLAHGYNHFIGASPRYIVETVGIIAIAALAYVASSQPGGIGSALPMLGAMALAAQRLLPMLQLGYASLATLRGASASVIDVLDALDKPLPHLPKSQPTLPFERAIELRQVSFRYANGVNVLESIDLRLEKGRRYGFVGMTGSGKSTLLDILMGLLSPTEGVFAIDGIPITDENRRGWQRHLAHVPQAIFLTDATIAENIAFGVPEAEIDLVRVMSAARLAQLAETIEAWPQGYQTSTGERGIRLSGGQRQRVGIARALYKNADVLILDEATSALDNATEAAVMAAINASGEARTVIIVAHRLSTLAHCDRIFEVADGRLREVDRAALSSPAGSVPVGAVSGATP